jgi:hypothetical protein
MPLTRSKKKPRTSALVVCAEISVELRIIKRRNIYHILAIIDAQNKNHILPISNKS